MGRKHRYFIIKKSRGPLFFFLCAALFLLSAALSGCSAEGKDTPIVKTVFGMDTVCSVTVYSEADVKAQEEALSLLSVYEKVFSRTDTESELYALNAAAGTECEVSEDLYSILDTCLGFCRLTEGRFDISFGGVSSLYDFTGDTGRVPSEEELGEAMRHTGYEKISLLPGNRVLVTDPELLIDLGAAAKGYTADRMYEVLVNAGVTSAYINLGGNVLTLGKKPSGTAFRVGIAKPEKDSAESLFTVEAESTSVVTSGTYQRSFEKDGVLWHHLLDTSTGLPLRNGLLSVTVVSGDSLTADILSTSCFALGPEGSESLLSGFPGVKAYFIDEDMNVSEKP